MNKILMISSFVISIVALAFAVNAYFHADRMADEALFRREQRLIDRMWPDMKVIYDDLLGGSTEYSGEKPETLEGLIKPLIIMVEEVGN